MVDWSSYFESALPYDKFLDQYATPSQRLRWDAMHARFGLNSAQRELIGGFARRMPVITSTQAPIQEQKPDAPVSGGAVTTSIIWKTIRR